MITADRRLDTVVSIGVDIIPGNCEYFMLACIRDLGGCSHFQFGGVTAHLLIETISRAIRAAFDSFALPGRAQ